jgi:SnoaL-like domain
MCRRAIDTPVRIAQRPKPQPCQPRGSAEYAARVADSVAQSLGGRFAEAFNRRDADGLVAVCHPEIEFHPTGAGGTGRSYHGHEGLRAWVEELNRGGLKHQVRILDVEEIDARRVVVSCELLSDGKVITPSTMIGVIAESALIEVHGHLTDITTLRQVQGIPD